MRTDADRENLTEEEQLWGRISGDSKFDQRQSITQHRNKEWETSIYQRSKDISREARPALGEYETDMVAKEVTLRGYKRMEKSRVRIFLLQLNLREPRDVSRGEIDGPHRRYKWEANVEFLRERRLGRYQEVNRMRRELSFLKRLVYNQTEAGIDTDEDGDPVGFVQNDVQMGREKRVREL